MQQTKEVPDIYSELDKKIDWCKTFIATHQALTQQEGATTEENDAEKDLAIKQLGMQLGNLKFYLKRMIAEKQINESAAQEIIDETIKFLDVNVTEITAAKNNYQKNVTDIFNKGKPKKTIGGCLIDLLAITTGITLALTAVAACAVIGFLIGGAIGGPVGATLGAFLAAGISASFIFGKIKKALFLLSLVEADDRKANEDELCRLTDAITPIASVVVQNTPLPLIQAQETKEHGSTPQEGEVPSPISTAP